MGFMLSFPLGQALGRVAAGLIFLGALLIGLILSFRLSPADVWEGIINMFESDKEGEENEEENREEDDKEESRRFKISAVLPQAGAAVSEVAGSSEAQRISKAAAANRRYRPAILKVLHSSKTNTARNKDLEKKNAETIRRTLEHFGINVEMRDTHVGPTVTQYTLRPDEGTKLAKITTLQNDLALSLAAHPIRIEAPIPNKDLVGIEIPNKTPTLVRLRDLLMSPEFKHHESPLAFPLGRDVSGKVVVDSLERMPHMLIAGATGSGKSVNIHTLLISWLYRNSPDAVRFIMVDPKRVELTPYTGIPHLLAPVIVDTEKTLNALKWALNEMDLRYRLLEESGSRNIRSFNTNNPAEARPYIVIVIDELADLMVKHAREIEGPIVRVSQMARAVGIHLVLATQRPSVNVLTGLIKANIPSRTAFSVASQVDSRTIIDMAGAEKLVGNGDMLYLSGDKARPIRIQGGFVSEEEVRDVVNLIKQTGEPRYDEAITSVAARESGGGGGGGGGDTGDDSLYNEAKQVVTQAGKASASFLQRRLKIGYARAARLLDTLEEQGVIGPAEGNKPRAILAGGGEEVKAIRGARTEAGNGAADEADGEKREYEEGEYGHDNRTW